MKCVICLVLVNVAVLIVTGATVCFLWAHGADGASFLALLILFAFGGECKKE